MKVTTFQTFRLTNKNSCLSDKLFKAIQENKVYASMSCRSKYVAKIPSGIV